MDRKRICSYQNGDDVVKVAIMQPTFMPYLGYFELIDRSDVFILADDFQFSSGSFHQRNRLFTKPNAAEWLTVPMRKESYKSQLCHVQIDETMPWRRKMLKTIQYNYSKSEYYDEYMPFIETWIMTKQSLAGMNIDFITHICELIGIRTKFALSSGHVTGTHRSQHIVDLLKSEKADCYVCARGSFDYMMEDKVFPLNDIDVEFQDFRCKPYNQIGSKDVFISHLSILDALFNIGSKDTLKYIRAGTYHWNTWNEMVNLRDEPCVIFTGDMNDSIQMPIYKDVIE